MRTARLARGDARSCSAPSRVDAHVARAERRAAARTAKRSFAPASRADCATQFGSSAFTIAVPPARMRANSSPFARAIASVEPSSSMCAVPTLTIDADVGLGDPRQLLDLARRVMPISTTPNCVARAQARAA